MANKKISELNALTTAASDDVLAIVDVSGTAETKKITVANLTGGGGTNNVLMNWAFYDSSVRDVYLPLSSEAENTSIQRYNRFISPFAGTLKRCSFISSNLQTGGTGTLTLEIGTITGTNTWTTAETATITLPLSAYTSSSFVFSTNTIAEGGRYAFKLTGQGSTAMGNCIGTLLFEIS